MLLVNPNITESKITTTESTTNNSHEQNKQYSAIKPLGNLEKTFSTFLPNISEESRLQKARRILGKTAIDETDEDLQIFLTNIQYLIDSWLDCFETEIFDGSTLKQRIK